MDRETVIKYMKQAAECDKVSWETCKRHSKCSSCPYNVQVPLIKLVRAALELLEAEEES